jgi:hypothetical protein
MGFGAIITPPACSSFSSATFYRARSRAGLSRNPKAIALYSFNRACTGGYYAVPEQMGKEILARKIPGVSQLHGPYNDLMNCW